MISGLTDSDGIPVLERLVQFAGARHRLLAHDIANVDTPDFRPVDVDPRAFQEQLGEAVDERRRRQGPGAVSGPIDPESTREIAFERNGIRLEPAPAGDNILFHDRNDRDPERLVQSLVENFMAFRAASDLLRNRFAALRMAIRERI